MQKRKRLIWVALCMSLILLLAGCTTNQQAIFDASMKMQSVNSVQEHITMSLELSGSGFDPEIQEQIDSAAAMLNDAKLDMYLKSISNEQKTAVQAQVDMNLSMPGQEINMPYWVDMDLTGSTPRFVEIFKLPEIAAAYLPPEAAGKEYMVIDLYDDDMYNQGLNTMDMAKLMEFSTGIQTKSLDFLAAYAQRFNPNIDVVKETINDSTEKYTITMSDAQLKEFLSYTVNNFAQDKEGINFLKDYMGAILELSAVSNSTEGYDDLELAVGEVDANIPEFLAQFNLVMEQLENVRLLGDKGVELTYTISDGYIVQNSGSINISLDMSAIEQLMNSPVAEYEGEYEYAYEDQFEYEYEDMMSNGTLDLVIHFNTDITNINQPVEIQFPEVNSDNSLNYLDLLEDSMIPEPEVTMPVTGTYTVKAGDTLGTIALNYYGSYKDATKIYQANLEVFKKSNNHLNAGMVLTLPAEGLLAPLSSDNVKQVYTVKAGDTLGTIAEKMYGNPSLYTKIFEANRERLDSPNRIYEGQWLVIPN